MPSISRPTSGRSSWSGSLFALALAACASSPQPAFREDLLETCWVLATLEGKAALAGAEATVCFPEEGRVSGSGGCNSYSASARFEGDSIAIGPIAATRMACEQAVMDQEQVFLQRLERTRRWILDGSTLLLYGDAPPAMRFTRLRDR